MSDAFCESDLHGRLTVLTSAGLLAETEVAGERGYRITDECRRALEEIGAIDASEDAVEPSSPASSEAPDSAS